MIRPATLPRSVIALLAAALALGLGCGKKEPSQGAPTAAAGGTDDSQVVYDKLGRDRDTYVRYIPANPDNLNPIIQRDTYSQYILEYVFDPLYRYDVNNNLALAPSFALSLPAITDGGKVFTVPLRKDARWTDGHPVTAHDWVYGYEMVVNKEVDSAQKKSYYADVEYFKAIDDFTLEIRMKKPYAFYGNLLTMNSVVPKHVFGNVSPAGFNSFKYPEGHKWAGTAYSLKPLGFGAYSVERFEPQK
ncbi:MAG TPA: ABC transporter substrate-binding protein, partial [Planctomycetota bacterium]|nr:ABC transporter substrate-binding protein [Planctomycetota bacterium]